MTADSSAPCISCHGDVWTEVLKIDSFRLLSCRRCKLLSLTPRQPSDQGGYHSSVEMQAYVDYMRPLRTRQYRDELRAIRAFQPSGKLLDLGCALGWFLAEARSAGFAADGLEPQADLAEIAMKENPGSKVFVGETAALEGLTEAYDVITLWSVVEHFADPESALSQIRATLTQTGLLALRTPNSKGLAEWASVLLFKLSGGKIRAPLDAILQLEFASKHWWLFSPKNLGALLKTHGFEVLKVYFSTSVDWRNIETWLKSRNMKPSRPVVLAMKLFFFLNEQIGRFGLADDFVLIARKVTLPNEQSAHVG